MPAITTRTTSIASSITARRRATFGGFGDRDEPRRVRRAVRAGRVPGASAGPDASGAAPARRRRGPTGAGPAGAAPGWRCAGRRWRRRGHRAAPGRRDEIGLGRRRVRQPTVRTGARRRCRRRRRGRPGRAPTSCIELGTRRRAHGAPSRTRLTACSACGRGGRRGRRRRARRPAPPRCACPSPGTSPRRAACAAITRGASRRARSRRASA